MTGASFPDRRRSRRRKRPALITRALIGVASIGTFVLLVSAMDPGQPAPDPSDASFPTTTASAVAASGRTASSVLTVGDIGRLSASLHAGSTPASPPTTGP